MAFEKGHAPYARREVPAPPLEQIIVSKFLLADAMGPRGQWLINRINQKWPHLSQATLTGRLRAWIGSNGHCLVKSARAVALSRITRTELDPLPIAEEVFLFTDPAKDRSLDKDGAAIHRHIGKWAKSLGADRYIIDRCSDCYSSDMVKLLGATEDIEVILPL